MMDLLKEIRSLCYVHNAVLMDRSSPAELAISVLSMIQNASFIFLTVLKVRSFVSASGTVAGS